MCLNKDLSKNLLTTKTIKRFFRLPASKSKFRIGDRPTVCFLISQSHRRCVRSFVSKSDSKENRTNRVLKPLLKSLFETKNESMNFCVFFVPEIYKIAQWFLWSIDFFSTPLSKRDFVRFSLESLFETNDLTHLRWDWLIRKRTAGRSPILNFDLLPGSLKKRFLVFVVKRFLLKSLFKNIGLVHFLKLLLR